MMQPGLLYLHAISFVGRTTSTSPTPSARHQSDAATLSHPPACHLFSRAKGGGHLRTWLAVSSQRVLAVPPRFHTVPVGRGFSTCPAARARE